MKYLENENENENADEFSEDEMLDEILSDEWFNNKIDSVTNKLYNNDSYDGIYNDGPLKPLVEKKISLVEEQKCLHRITIIFTQSAIDLLKRLCVYLTEHPIFHTIVEDFQLLMAVDLENVFDQKFGTYVSIQAHNKRTNYMGDLILYDSNIIAETNRIINYGIYSAVKELPPENTIAHMLDGYPITLLSTICGVDRYYVHNLGESMKSFIKVQQKHKRCIPRQLYSVIDSMVPLIGHEKSPMTQDELDTVYKYLNCKKTIYVHILLNSLFELAHQVKYLNKSDITEEMINTICESSWLYLLISPK